MYLVLLIISSKLFLNYLTRKARFEDNNFLGTLFYAQEGSLSSVYKEKESFLEGLAKMFCFCFKDCLCPLFFYLLVVIIWFFISGVKF